MRPKVSAQKLVTEGFDILSETTTAFLPSGEKTLWREGVQENANTTNNMNKHLFTQ